LRDAYLKRSNISASFGANVINGFPIQDARAESVTYENRQKRACQSLHMGNVEIPIFYYEFIKNCQAIVNNHNWSEEWSKLSTFGL
jgi:hypothetical protein